MSRLVECRCPNHHPIVLLDVGIDDASVAENARCISGLQRLVEMALEPPRLLEPQCQTCGAVWTTWTYAVRVVRRIRLEEARVLLQGWELSLRVAERIGMRPRRERYVN